jgi:hypothetical protein
MHAGVRGLGGLVDDLSGVTCFCLLLFAWFRLAVVAGHEPHVPWPILLHHYDQLHKLLCWKKGLIHVHFANHANFTALVLRRKVRFTFTSQETESQFTERIGNRHNIYLSDQGKLFFTRSFMLLLTTSTLCSFVCTKSICYVHNSCAQVRLLCISLCYVYNIDFCAD